MYVCTCMCVCMHVCTCIHVYAWVWRSEYNIMSFLRRQQPCYWFLFWFVIAVLGIEPRASYMPAGGRLLSYSPSPHFDFWNGLSLAWRLINRLDWLAREPQGSTCLCLPSAGVTSTITSSLVVLFECGFWGLNSSSCACDAEMLWVESSLQPPRQWPSNQSDTLLYTLS